jgi:hypothetical protein
MDGERPATSRTIESGVIVLAAFCDWVIKSWHFVIGHVARTQITGGSRSLPVLSDVHPRMHPFYKRRHPKLS